MASPQTNISLEDLAGLLASLDDFAICGHVSPDGDCVGSQLALYHALRALGKKAVCLLAQERPLDRGLLFLPGSGDMVPASGFHGTPQVFIACDVPTRERLGAGALVLDKCVSSITIDHHATQNTMSRYNYIDPDIASTSMIVWNLIGCMGVDPDRAMAICALTGLITDTGGFQFQNADASALRAAGDMAAIGASPAEVARNVFQSRSIASLALEEVMLSHMEMSKDNTFAFSYLSRKDFESAKAQKEDADPLINILRSIEGVEVACIIREDDGFIRGSLRAKNEVDVAAIARSLGGGGHKAAAGFTLQGPLEDAIATVKGRIEAVLD